MNDLPLNSAARDAWRPKRLVLAYSLMLLATVGVFLGICWLGTRNAAEVVPRTSSVASSTSTAAADHGASSATLGRVLGALVVITAASRVVGAVFQRLGQPRVMGEVVAGLLLGPSFLGRISPDAMQFMLPSSIAPQLSLIAQLGVILYMFLVGLELNVDELRSSAHSAVAISHASIVAPFLLGAGLALLLFDRFAPDHVSFISFALFMGVAMAITAFPVLARILTDRGIANSELGVIALSCAAADDVTAWCLLAFVVGVAQAELTQAIQAVSLTFTYVALVLMFARPFLRRWLVPAADSQRSDGSHAASSHAASSHATSSHAAGVLIALLISAFITEAIGIHAIFGAFLLGAVVPHDSPIARAFRGKLADTVSILFLPTFFAYTGLRTQIGLVDGWSDWLICAAIILVATLGKFGGTLAAARWTGLDWRTSASLGILMNTRGLMELIVLNTGLDLGVISPRLFAMMVLMALATTLMTAPILTRLQHGRSPAATAS